MSTFVDTGAFYALADTRDERHDRARSYYASHYKPGLFLTSEYVFVESRTLIQNKLGKTAARKFWETIRMNVFTLQRVTALDLERAWEIFRAYEDQSFSLADCTSFAIMERLKIIEAFSFDVHFSVFRTKAGAIFQVFPS